MGDIPAVRVRSGRVVTLPAGGLAVNIDGAYPPVMWPAGYIPQAGDTVRVLYADGAATVLGPVTTGQRPLTGTVTAGPSSGRVTVSTTSGSVSARYVGTAPSISDVVRLDWQSTTPWVWPSAAVASAADPGPDPEDVPAAPSRPQTGTLSAAAVTSGTWSSAGAWDSYYGSSVVQGSYNGRTYTGSWFYGDAPRRVAGRTITAARIRIGARRRMGNYNASIVLSLYRHTSPTRGSGDVARVEGPHDVTLGVNAGAGWVDLPTAWGQAIADAGGGVSVAGSTYGGVNGIGDDPASGQIQLDWRR